MKEKDVPDHQAGPPLPTLEELQHWTGVMGRAQQMMMEFGVAQSQAPLAAALPAMEELARAQADFWSQSMSMWQQAVLPPADAAALADKAARDKRFAAPEWQQNAFFDMIRQSYMLVADRLLGSVDALPGVDEDSRRKLRFATQTFLDAMAPSNFPLTNPLVVQRTVNTGGENLLKGLENMLRDLAKGQLTHTDPDAFEVGRNIAVTPGKVVRQTPLYQLIQYSPTTDEVLEKPLIIFPPWINRYYILDLNPKKSFIRWAVEQGLTVFVVSWKSADESLAGTQLDDYVLAQVEAIDTVRDLLDTPAVHAIGYCVAGTMLAATLALLDARGEAQKVASATFFTAQVDFSSAGDLSLFTGDEQLQLIQQLSADRGYLDGRYMAATFNLLRGRDLIWNYVVNNYLLGEDYPPFDLLHWNGDTTNLPATWHHAYLTQLYRENRLVEPGGIEIDGVAIDLSRVRTPTYVQAGREDHIAPAESVWKITHHFQGPLRFVLAGSGHIAGVVNPPAVQKYAFWTNEAQVDSLDAFIAGAAETKGSWWPDWMAWIRDKGSAAVPATGARVPGEGALPAIEDAPGSYVRGR